MSHTIHGIVLSSISDVGSDFASLCTAQKSQIAQFIGFIRHPILTAFCLPKIRLAMPINSKSVQDSVGTEFILTPKEAMLYTIDGDLYTCGGRFVIQGPAGNL